MTTQYDVKGLQINGSGQLIVGRWRMKNIVILGNGTAGRIDIFDTITAPTSVTYGQTGTTITVTHNAHGYVAGQAVGLAFAPASGVSPLSGDYIIQTVATNTYTVTTINSATISTGTAALEGTRWMASYETGTNLQPFQILIPGEGVLAYNGIYAAVTNITNVTIYYG